MYNTIISCIKCSKHTTVCALTKYCIIPCTPNKSVQIIPSSIEEASNLEQL